MSRAARPHHATAVASSNGHRDLPHLWPSFRRTPLGATSGEKEWWATPTPNEMVYSAAPAIDEAIVENRQPYEVSENRQGVPYDRSFLERVAQMDVLNEVCAGRPTGNEENIKNKIVVPLLEILGYDPIKDLDYERHVKSGRPDITVLYKGKPTLIVETKGLDKDLDEYKEQGLGYARDLGIPWTILTNGVQWDLYKTFIEGVPQEENEPLVTVYSKEFPGKFDDLAGFVSHQAIEHIETLARDRVQLVTRKARVSDLARILREFRTKLFWDLRAQFDRRYDFDRDFTEKVKLWAKEMGVDVNYDWYDVYKEDKKFRAFILHRLGQNGLPNTASKKDFDGSYRKLRKEGFTEQVDIALRREGIPLDWLDRLCFEGAYSLINRLLFLRICEDSGLVARELTNDTLARLARAEDNAVLVTRLEGMFASMGSKYPGVYKLPLLDHLFLADLEWNGATVSDLCKETMAYNFSELGDVLGHLYQKHLDINARRLIGQFYTHEDKVDYILSTVTPWLHDGARILDPACGSGSFLVGVHRAMFPRLLARRYNPGTAHRHLLENVLHGVDIDSFAAQLTAINLLVRNLDSPVGGLEIFVGNSLISNDTLARFGVEVARPRQTPDPRAPTESTRDARSILKDGSFDVIVGNPPFFRVGLGDEIYGSALRTSQYSVVRPEGAEMNIATMFLKRCVDWLKPAVESPEGRGGICALVMPKSLTYVDEYRLVRKYLLDRCYVRKIVDLGRGWQDVGLEHVIIVFERRPDGLDVKPDQEVEVIHDVESFRRGIFSRHSVNENVFRTDPRNRFLLYVLGPGAGIREKMNRLGQPLKTFQWTVWEGIRDDHNVHRFDSRQNARSVPLLNGPAIRRWYTRPGEFVDNADPHIPDGIKNKCKVSEKIVIKRVLSSKVRVEAVVDRERSITHSSTTGVSFQDGTSTRYVTGILNSRLMNLYVRDWLFNRTELTMNFREEYLGELPVPKAPDAERKRAIEERVQELESLYDQYSSGDAPPPSVQAQASEIKQLLDEAVFDLYDLTSEERAFVREVMPYSE